MNSINCSIIVLVSSFVLISIVFLIFKPSCIIYDNKHNNTKKIDISLLIFYSLDLSFILAILTFIFTREKLKVNAFTSDPTKESSFTGEIIFA
tara:strand:+ start:140 stop:418 length:279 start_codon:yes stop_codon:yes gene_type:complete